MMMIMMMMMMMMMIMVIAMLRIVRSKIVMIILMVVACVVFVRAVNFWCGIGEGVVLTSVNGGNTARPCHPVSEAGDGSGSIIPFSPLSCGF